MPCGPSGVFIMIGATVIVLAKTGVWIESKRNMAVIVAAIFVMSFALKLVVVCLRIFPQVVQ